ncbi:MAG TPA: 8-amino-7-oxononanoate synthase [Chitinophagaceae bacterium]
MNEDFLHTKLNERKELNAFRQLRLPKKGMIDFCSNDYLGIVKNNRLSTYHDLKPAHAYGATGSRLLTGNYELIEETEKFIADFHQAKTGLIFNSGYDANIGLLSSVPQRGDTILYDYLSHASIRDGIRLSFATSFSFTHNDLHELEEKLKKATGNIFVVTESVFSMDGDLCPLAEMVNLCEKYNARLIIDEAHATGVIGEKGEGLVQLLGLQDKIFARVHTFGKACGSHGAVVLGSNALRDYLVNFARSFIYSTALPEQTIVHIKESYTLFPGMSEERQHLKKLVANFKHSTLPAGSQIFNAQESDTPIQGIIIPGNEKVKQVAAQLQALNLDIRPILYPTVPKGKERLRIVLHAFNTFEELELLLNSLKNSL